MKELILCGIARILALPVIADWLIHKARKTPYFHLGNPDGTEVYMERYWLLNPYDRKTNKPKWSWFPWSIRLHFIRREDRDPHTHDHPWNARTFILKGWYREERVVGQHRVLRPWFDADSGKVKDREAWAPRTIFYIRSAGHTAALRFGEYHRITAVSPWQCPVTLFISGPYQGTWGFLVDGVKVQWKKYLGIPDDGDLKPMDAE